MTWWLQHLGAIFINAALLPAHSLARGLALAHAKPAPQEATSIVCHSYARTPKSGSHLSRMTYDTSGPRARRGKPPSAPRPTTGGEDGRQHAKAPGSHAWEPGALKRSATDRYVLRR